MREGVGEVTVLGGQASRTDRIPRTCRARPAAAVATGLGVSREDLGPGAAAGGEGTQRCHDGAHEGVHGVLDIGGVAGREAVRTLLCPGEALQEPRVLPGETLHVHLGPAADRLLVTRELLERLLGARFELLGGARAGVLARA